MNGLWSRSASSLPSGAMAGVSPAGEFAGKTFKKEQDLRDSLAPGPFASNSWAHSGKLSAYWL